MLWAYWTHGALLQVRVPHVYLGLFTEGFYCCGKGSIMVSKTLNMIHDHWIGILVGELLTQMDWAMG